MILVRIMVKGLIFVLSELQQRSNSAAFFPIWLVFCVLMHLLMHVILTLFDKDCKIGIKMSIWYCKNIKYNIKRTFSIHNFFFLLHKKFSKWFKTRFYYSLLTSYVSNTFYYYYFESTKKKIKYYEIILLEKKKKISPFNFFNITLLRFLFLYFS